MQPLKKILIVDDDDEVRKTLTDLLQEGGYNACGVPSGREAIDKAASEHFDLIFLDIIMPQMGGIETLSELRKVNAKTPVIMITAFPVMEDAIDAVKKGACDYISKPFRCDELFSKVGRTIEEAGFEEYFTDAELDRILNSLANPIRRNILKLLSSRSSARLTDITRELNIDDPSKMVFHLKILREGRIVKQVQGRSYSLTAEGKKVLDCLRTLENNLLK